MDEVSGRRGFGAVVWFPCPAPLAVFPGLARGVGDGIFIFGLLFLGGSRFRFVRCLGLERESVRDVGTLGGGAPRRSTFFSRCECGVVHWNPESDDATGTGLGPCRKWH